MQKRTLLLALILLISNLSLRADEGMWIPMLLKKYNIEDMQKKGFKLTAEDIYNINQASLKDAVIGLGRAGRPFSHFCTGELVSNEGLVFTNHHCAFGLIQAHSNLENNYIRDGFWAKDKSEELANPSITASILVRMEDVTNEIMSKLKEDMTLQEREDKIKEISLKLEKKAVKGTNLQANIKPFFNGNQYFMSVYKIYKDVRLVGAPSEAIGGFGGDTDNWVWPRHTGDFSILRIYAGEDNEPAEYSENNKPYQPKKFFKISTKGVNAGDFTMVFGYPGTTKQYIPSFAIKELVNIDYPHKVNIRTAKLDVINAAMNSDEILRIKYSAKAASISNAWKKWQGEIKGLKRFNTVAKKQDLEQKFKLWIKDKPEYKEIISEYEKIYNERQEAILEYAYLSEAGKNGAEILAWSAKVMQYLKEIQKGAKIEDIKQKITKDADKFYKDFDTNTDKAIFKSLLALYKNNILVEHQPITIQNVVNNEDAIYKYAENLYNNSIFSNEEKLMKSLDQLDKTTYDKFKDDLAYTYYQSISKTAEPIQALLVRTNQQINNLNSKWMKAIMSMQPERTFFADANSTLRVAYGNVSGYEPKDGVVYKHYTTLAGIIEKDNPNIYDYDVPQKLRDLYATKDFGDYAYNGDVPVCFVATNHTTGGNSGSPVLNADGHLIGINFDRAWDGVMSDLQFDPNICRNIAVDIRYVLFIIDKYADANHLLEEMEIVK